LHGPDRVPQDKTLTGFAPAGAKPPVALLACLSIAAMLKPLGDTLYRFLNWGRMGGATPVVGL